MSDPTFRTRPGLRREHLRYRFRIPRADDAFLRAGVAGAYLPRILLNVPHRPQQEVSGSVPCCASMVLAAHGLDMRPEQLAGVLGTEELSGPPGRCLQALRRWGIRTESPRELQRFRDGTRELNFSLATGSHRLVYRWEEAWLRYVRGALKEGEPVILFVDLGRLSSTWRGLSHRHSVVLAGGDARRAWIHDPARSWGPERVGLGTLMDALLPGEPLAVVLRPECRRGPLGTGAGEGR